jgi:hypothetical protein
MNETDGREKEIRMKNRPKPQIGQTCEVYGQRCVIIDVEDYGHHGNVIVQVAGVERYYRLSGLSWD